MKRRTTKKQQKKDACNANEQCSEKENAKTAEKKSSGLHMPKIDLGVATGVALLAVEQAGKAVVNVTKNWEENIDNVAEKAHETIETAQRVMKHPMSETMHQLDNLQHPEKKEAEKKSA